MRFDANRLATLAGISSDSGIRPLNESGNQSKRDEGHDEGYDYYEKQLAEQGVPAGEPVEDLYYDEESDAEPGVMAEPGIDDEELAMVDDLDVNPFAMAELDDPGSVLERKKGSEVVEINESMLRREIARMRSERSNRSNKRQSTRSRQSLNEESQLRDAIRKEIGSIINEMGDGHLYTTKNWLYGDKKPKNSKHGYVARGGFGIGF